MFLVSFLTDLITLASMDGLLFRWVFSASCQAERRLQYTYEVETTLLLLLLTYLLTCLLTYLLQLSCHSVAVVFTPVQTKRIRINIHKRNNTKTKYKQYMYTYYQSTNKIVKSPTHTHTHTNTHQKISYNNHSIRNTPN
jgi:hypothetical protein